MPSGLALPRQSPESVTSPQLRPQTPVKLQTSADERQHQVECTGRWRWLVVGKLLTFIQVPVHLVSSWTLQFRSRRQIIPKVVSPVCLVAVVVILLCTAWPDLHGCRLSWQGALALCGAGKWLCVSCQYSILVNSKWLAMLWSTPVRAQCSLFKFSSQRLTPSSINPLPTVSVFLFFFLLLFPFLFQQVR